MYIDPRGLIGIMPDGTIYMDEDDTNIDKQLLQLKIDYKNATSNAERSRITKKARTIRKNNEGQYKVLAEHSISNYYIPDLTDKLHRFVIAQTETFALHAGDLQWFRENVDYGKIVDLKENPEFARPGYSYHVIYNGEVYRGDMPGNFAYGYLGKVALFPDLVLYVGAGVAQQTNQSAPKDWRWIFSDFGDAPGDRAFIDMGISYYYEYWGPSGYVAPPQPGPAPR